ncbi:MAG: flagellar hook-associated protein 3 [Epsilonproteobacteria bacterium]|nr:MAG: flagellar hook-associated protein 3 [Campylobacterota bacterium]RLA67524.1 MAG: flagellar hook-associated protein 3 [Campylobacterota bacterium]
MTRVSDNASTNALNFALNKAKSKIQNLQLKGASLKNINKPSDDPLGNIKVLKITSRIANNDQYLKNADKAISRLYATEDALTQMGEILLKAKELAIGQSSDLYDARTRKNVAEEVKELKNNALSVANKRIGERYIFGGFSSLKPPFSKDGEYLGDGNYMTLEVAKDYFVPINLPGSEVFITSKPIKSGTRDPLSSFPELKNKTQNAVLKREITAQKFHKGENILAQLDILANALENNNAETIRGLLEKMDDSMSRMISMRTKVGSIAKNIQHAVDTIHVDKVNDLDYKSKILDADVAELFSDISRQNNVMKTAYHSSKIALNQSLFDWLR